jgi:hypothetical protein
VSLSVPENKPVGTLTERQRLALAAVLTAKSSPAGSDPETAGSGVPEAHPPGSLTTREGALTAA